MGTTRRVGAAALLAVATGAASSAVAQTAESPRRQMTPAMLASAYVDSGARALVAKARAARLRTDKALAKYVARTWQRATLGLKLGADGPERVFWRQEQAGRVTWRRGSGATIEVEGLRTASPGAPGVLQGGPPPTVPWFPGKEQLWIGTGGVVQAEVDERRTINPLAEGSEAYYTFRLGDSTSLMLPGGERLVLRELRVRPRAPAWNVAVGSYWFDDATGQLVRAIYRLTIPVNLSDRVQGAVRRGDARVPFALRALAFPVTGRITAVTVEYGRYAERFWLPRLQVAEGTVTANVATLPVSYEERFRYEDVVADTTGSVTDDAPGVTPPADAPLPPAWESLRERPVAARRAAFEEYQRAVAASRERQCAQGRTWVLPTPRYRGQLNAVQAVPCDTAALASDDRFDGPIFPADEQPFAREAGAELDRALGLEAQPAVEPQPVRWQWPSERGLLRFNRVEGPSAGFGAAQELGAGLSWTAAARIGLADRWPNASVALARSNGRTTQGVRAWRGLASLNAWGAPFTFGESFLAAAAGRDEGFYARTAGLEATIERDAAWRTTWRLSAERVTPASVATDRRTVLGWEPARLGTPSAVRAGWYGIAHWRARRAFGADPRTWRWSTMADAEAGVGTVGYGRLWLEGSMMRGLGPASLALTLSAGDGLGVPSHRQWWIGGARTVRGQPAGTQVGTAFHLGQAELGWQLGPARLLAHADAGWAGATADRWRGRPVSGAGAGVSFLDGLLRVDVSRGLAPARAGGRVDVTFDARF